VESVAMQVLDLILDLSFSKRANGILRKNIVGVSPANYLMNFQPSVISFPSEQSLLELFSPTSNRSVTGQGSQGLDLFSKNQSRRLFGKYVSNTKFFVPPAEEFSSNEQLKLVHWHYAQNQRTILDLFESMLIAHPGLFRNFTDMLLIRVTSSYPMPSDEQYNDILPTRSNYDADIFLKKILTQNPILISMLSTLANGVLIFFSNFIHFKKPNWRLLLQTQENFVNAW
jgi:hypothetical protein